MKNGSTERHRLIISVATDPTDPVLWMRIDAHGETDRQRGELPITELATLAARFPGDLCHLLVPMADVVIHCVTLPGKHDAAGMRALPWLLEEKLALPPDDVTFIPLASEGQNLWVATVANARMAQWTEPFRVAGIRLSYITPDALLLPLNTEGASALYWQHRWLLRTGRWQGAQVDAAWLALWHTAWQREQTALGYVDCYSPLPENVTQWRARPMQDALTLLASNIKPQTPSLLPAPSALRAVPWRRPLIAACAALCLLFVQQGLLWWQTAQQADALEQQLQLRFPGKSMAERQSAMRVATRQDKHPTLTSLLAKLPALPEGVTIERLHYLNTTSSLRLTLRGQPEKISEAHQSLTRNFRLQTENDQLILTLRKHQP
jgi:general secretion pathway protein L